MKRETKFLLLAAQNNAICNYYAKAKFGNTQENRESRLSGEKERERERGGERARGKRLIA